jgi:hypothetical protein
VQVLHFDDESWLTLVIPPGQESAAEATPTDTMTAKPKRRATAIRFAELKVAKEALKKAPAPNPQLLFSKNSHKGGARLCAHAWIPLGRLPFLASLMGYARPHARGSE